MSIINCEYCNKVFKTKSSLNNHKNKAKYCLLIQQKNIEAEEDKFKCSICEKILSSRRNLEVHNYKCKGKFKCGFCNKILSTKRNLESHLVCCDERKDKEIKELTEKEINILKEMNKRTEKEIEELSKLNEIKDKELVEKDKVIIKLNTQIEELVKQEGNYKEQLLDLQNKLDKIANKAIDRPTTVVSNTTTNNNLNIMSSIDFNDLENIKYFSVQKPELLRSKVSLIYLLTIR